MTPSPTTTTTVCETTESGEVDPAWKKAAIMLWKQIADHKYASIFMNPVKDEQARSYSTVVKGFIKIIFYFIIFYN